MTTPTITWSGISIAAPPVPIPAPDAPADLVAIAQTSSQALSWVASARAQTYNVYRGTAPGGESPTPIATGLTGTTYADNTAPTSIFYYTVKAVGAGGTSGPSNEAVATWPTSGAPYAGSLDDWLLNDNAGNGTWLSASGNFNFTGSGSPTSSAGRLGQALTLSGSSQYLTRATSPINATQSFSLFGLAKFASISGTQALFCKFQSSREYVLYLLSGQLRWNTAATPIDLIDYFGGAIPTGIPIPIQVSFDVTNNVVGMNMNGRGWIYTTMAGTISPGSDALTIGQFQGTQFMDGTMERWACRQSAPSNVIAKYDLDWLGGQVRANAPCLIGVGNSIMRGQTDNGDPAMSFDSAVDPIAAASGNLGWTNYQNYALGGSTTVQALSVLHGVQALGISTLRQQCVVILWEGRNHIEVGDGAVSGQQAFNALMLAADEFVALGARVIIPTLIPGEDLFNNGLDPNRLACNVLLRGQTTYQIIDLANDPNFSAFTNPLYTAGGVHLITSGYTYLAGVFSAAVLARPAVGPGPYVQLAAPPARVFRSKFK